MSGCRPPRLLERILKATLPAGLSGQGTLGDLAEEFERRALSSPMRARLWYALQTVSIVGYRLFARGARPRSRPGAHLLMDLRWSFRSLLKHPGFTLGLVAVLGLGLGANTAVYAVLDGTLRGASWWSDPDATVAIWPGHKFSHGHMEIFQDEQVVYRTVGAYAELAFALQTPDGDSASVNGASITPSLFRELDVQPLLGRGLEDDDALWGGEPVAVLGERVWRQTFDADPAVVGSRITVNGSPATVVGVQPAAGKAPGGRAEVWLPLVMDPRDDDYFKKQTLTLVGVLQDGASLDDAQADLLAYTATLSDMFPMFYPKGYGVGEAHVAPADEEQRRLIATPLLLLFAGTGLLLLVTALNVGNLLLGRSVDRRRELAVRLSIGAGRGRIVGQLMVEGFLLTMLATGVGLGVATLGARWIEGLFVEQAIVAGSSVFAPAVLSFALTIAAGAWFVVNIVPVVHFLRSQRAGINMKPDSGAGTQRVLVAVQAALATLLLVSATLLVATVDNLRQVPLGFDPGRVIAMELSTPADRVASAPVARELYDRLVERVAALPGVESVGLTGWLPLRAQAPETPINLEAAPVDPRESVKAPKQLVDPGFFETLGIEATRGRLISYEEREDLIPVNAGTTDPQPSGVVVNETLANMLWPDGNVIGQRIAIDPHAWDYWAPVIGVVPDVRSGGITGPIGPALYVSLAENPSRDVTLVVRSDLAPGELYPMLRRAVREVDELVPIRSISEMENVVRAAYATSWVMMGLLIVLAGLATGLGALGIYAVLAHHVALNKREIGVRMALGARPGTVVGGVVRSGVALASVGIVMGCVAAAMSTRLLESLLFEVSALAPWAFAAPAIALVAAAVLAAWVPAARAGRLPPAEVLKGD